MAQKQQLTIGRIMGKRIASSVNGLNRPLPQGSLIAVWARATAGCPDFGDLGFQSTWRALGAPTQRKSGNSIPRLKKAHYKRCSTLAAPSEFSLRSSLTMAASVADAKAAR